MIKTYSGPKSSISPEDLKLKEKMKRYVIEEKVDGFWSEVSTDSNGVVTKIVGRTGKEFVASHVEGLIGLPTHMPNSVFICELQSGTEAAIRRTQTKRLYVFDVIKCLGQETTSLEHWKRRELLQLAHARLPKATKTKIVLTEQRTQGFTDFYREVMQRGGEGVVLKLADKPYKFGKTDDWIRCKKHRHVDYVVLDVGKSKGGADNLQVGLFAGGRLARVMTVKDPPRRLDLQSLIGKVIECRGAEVHSSGALRHGHYERTRDDKRPEECTLEAALRA